MKLLLDILQGIGLSAAAGVRPFLPTLAAGALASADVGVDYDRTAFSFLEAPVFLLAVAVALVASLLLRSRLDTPAGAAALSGIGVGLGALLFAGTLDDRNAVRDLFARTRARLDTEAAAALPIYAEGAAVVLAALSILVPPVSVLAVAFFAWLLAGGRRRAGEKYAGLRILR